MDGYLIIQTGSGIIGPYVVLGHGALKNRLKGRQPSEKDRNGKKRCCLSQTEVRKAQDQRKWRTKWRRQKLHMVGRPGEYTRTLGSSSALCLWAKYNIQQCKSDMICHCHGATAFLLGSPLWLGLSKSLQLHRQPHCPVLCYMYYGSQSEVDLCWAHLGLLVAGESTPLSDTLWLLCTGGHEPHVFLNSPMRTLSIMTPAWSGSHGSPSPYTVRWQYASFECCDIFHS